VFDVGADGVVVEASDEKTITLSFGSAKSAKAFFDDRMYPWHSGMLRVADVNGNGVRGAELGISLITPGEPLKSYLVLRLFDPAYGDLMPRQCRKWTDEATRALGCWVKGLVTDGSGQVQNAADPIHYDTCDFSPLGQGKCGTGADVGAIFARSCAGQSCHVGEAKPAAELDLSEGKWQSSLIGVPSTQDPEKIRVTAGDLDASYLACKLDEACEARVGGVMPSGDGELSNEDRVALLAWIKAGAPIDP
jgi:hypothetical protein